MTPPGHEPLLLFRAIAHNPEFLDAFRRFGTYLLSFGRVEARDRELLIHRTTARCGADYEWAVHVFFYGERVGLSREEIAATYERRAAGELALSPRQQVLVKLADELHDSSTVSAELWDELQAQWSPEEIVELVGLVGQYHLVSFLVNALGVEHEEYARDLVPSAKRP